MSCVAKMSTVRHILVRQSYARVRIPVCIRSLAFVTQLCLLVWPALAMNLLYLNVFGTFGKVIFCVGCSIFTSLGNLDTNRGN